ncbi:MAG: hypothetical protein EOM93_06450, partial [Gammaproteobacteria bacterium]|nr:hypothetical protein [Gammaproteobacteria bacterium]
MRRLNLRFFGGGGGSSEQVRKRDPEDPKLIELRERLLKLTNPGMDYMEGSYDPDSVPERFKETVERERLADEEAKKYLFDRVPGAFDRYDEAIDLQKQLMTEGVPEHFQQALYDSINRNARENMGSFLAKAAGSGTVNSSISNVGLNNINRESQDQMSSQYLNMFDSLGQQYGNYTDQSRLAIGENQKQYDYLMKDKRDAWQDYYLP